MKDYLKQLIREEINKILSEGIHDPGILKAVFLGGGPGSGKSYTSRLLFSIPKLQTLYSSTAASGLKIVNSDTVFEKALKDANVPLDKLGKIADEDPEQWADIMKIRDKAKNTTAAQLRAYLNGRLGILVDTTSNNIEKITKQRLNMSRLGYDTYLIFVNTSLDVALERNRFRGTQGERTISDELVKTIWNEAQESLNELKQIFGESNVIIVDNSKTGPLDSQYQKAVDKILREPIKNQIGKDWIKNKLKK